MALESFTDEQKQEAYEVAYASVLTSVWAAQISDDEERISVLTTIDVALRIAFDQPSGAPLPDPIPDPEP